MTDQKRKDFTLVENAIIRDLALNAYDKALYLTLCMYADYETRTCYPSIGTLSRLLSCSKKRVRSSLDGLQQRGYIHTERRRDAERGNISNLYRIIKPLVSEGNHPSISQTPGLEATGDHPSISGEPKQYPFNENHLNTNLPSVSGKNDYPAEFELFWAAYPRKLEKKAAVTAWKKAAKQTSPYLLTRAAAGYAEHCRRENTAQQYIKHAARFLNSGAFDDYMAEPETSPPLPHEPDDYLQRMRELARGKADD